MIYMIIVGRLNADGARSDLHSSFMVLIHFDVVVKSII